MERKCCDCEWFYDGEDCSCTSGIGSVDIELLPKGTDSGHGQCRRYPPERVDGFDNNNSDLAFESIVIDYQFPIVAEFFWCGEFIPKQKDGE